MMGRHEKQQEMWAEPVQLGRLIPAAAPLRGINRVLRLDFVREEVARFYGRNGNESVDPVIVVKLMLLLFLDNVASERELMRVTAMRLDYRWFLGYDLTDAVPHHSVLSKARAKWGGELFQRLFERVVTQCVEAGLVDAGKIHLDSSLIDADTALKTVRKFSSEEIAAACAKTAQRLEEPAAEPPKENLRSTTDPDAAVIKHGHKPARPRYKTHRAVEDKTGVITAVETTPGGVHDGSRMTPLMEQHEKTTGQGAATVIADSKYGTADNFAAGQRQGLQTHMADTALLLEQARNRHPETVRLFAEKDFSYDEETDTYLCPAGERLRRRTRPEGETIRKYAGRKSICGPCPLRAQCMTGQTGRIVNRHEHQPLVDVGREQSRSPQAKADRKRRQYWMEGSFADAANNHGLKRARWRGLWRQAIQDLLIATCQNLRKLGKALWQLFCRCLRLSSPLEALRRATSLFLQLLPVFRPSQTANFICS
jgi:transposase